MTKFFLSVLFIITLAGCGQIDWFPQTNITSTVTITTTTLPNATVGTAYSQTLTATGGTTPYTWTVTSGTLPTGLSLSTAGVISGTPTAAGTSSFTVQVTDSSNPAQTATQSLTLQVV